MILPSEVNRRLIHRYECSITLNEGQLLGILNKHFAIENSSLEIEFKGEKLKANSIINLTWTELLEDDWLKFLCSESS